MVRCRRRSAGGMRPTDMAKRKKAEARRAGAQLERRPVRVRDIYDLSTPLLDRFIQRVRRHVRFPRYYDAQENW